MRLPFRIVAHLSLKPVYSIYCDYSWTAPWKSTDRLSLSTMSELELGACTVRFWKSWSSNNDHMARCRGCSVALPLAYGLHVYAEEPRLSRLQTLSRLLMK